MIKSIPESKKEDFEKKLSRLNKMQEKYGLPLTTAKLVGEHAESLETREHVKGESFRFDALNTIKVRMLDFEIENLDIVMADKEVEFIGTRTRKGDIFVISCANKDDIPIVSKDVEVCDHCHTQRQRNKYFVFRKKDGTIIRVGSTCVEEYFGVDVSMYLSCFVNTFFLVNDCSDEYDDDHQLKPTIRDYCFDWDVIYKYTKDATEGFTEWRQGYVIPHTELLHNTKYFTAGDFSDKIEPIRKYWNEHKDESGFAFNCNSVMEKDYANYDNLTLACAALYFGTLELDKQKCADVPQPTYTENEAVRFSGVVETVKRCETYYGITYLVVVNCEGVRYKMFTTSKAIKSLTTGDKAEMSATFKESETYKGRTLQVVRKPKLLSVEKTQDEMNANLQQAGE